MKKLLLPILVLFLMVGFKTVETKKITGTVRDMNGVLPGVSIQTNKSKHKTITDRKGMFAIETTKDDTELLFAAIGFKTQRIKIAGKARIDVALLEDFQTLQDVVVSGYSNQAKRSEVVVEMAMAAPLQGRVPGVVIGGQSRMRPASRIQDNESYAALGENGFHKSVTDPLSTFSIDVDAAAYSNMRRYINGGSLPPADAVRIEEMVNYFNYNYAQPQVNDPVNITTEVSAAPWNKNHRLVHIGLQAKTISNENLPASNLVFLIDVSGSMSDQNKLPLLISSFKLLTDQLRAKDRVAIVVYAGNSGVVLPATSGSHKIKIKEALNKLNAGGSTAGGAGIELAYKIASENFVKGGNNRVIMATDGDFNVGSNSDAEMERLIEAKRKSGVFLTVLGYGMGNYKDSKMEVLADKGNGNYAYIDNLSEARKVLVHEFGGTLFTVAKDVKLQVEFNPASVQSYRLIGYENRMLSKEDFNDDKKDAGELGSGHTVTALYEIIPVGIKDQFTGTVDPLRYQKPDQIKANASGEIMTVKLRYKDPSGSKSKLLSKAVMEGSGTVSDNFRFSAAVAEFGMILRKSKFRQNSDFDQVIELAQNSKGKDLEGYRAEFISLVKSAKLMGADLLSLKSKRSMKKEN